MTYDDFLDKWAAAATQDVYGSFKQENDAKRKNRAALKKDLDSLLRSKAYSIRKKMKKEDEKESPQPGQWTES